MDTGPIDGDSPCPRCHGAGTVSVALCCGRGCATCSGDGLYREIECRRCRGTGRLAAPEPRAAAPRR